MKYNGGETSIDLNKVDAILLYGASGAMPVAFLDELATRRVPLLISRRNLPNPYVFIPGWRRDDRDTLSSQIRCRDRC